MHTNRRFGLVAVTVAVVLFLAALAPASAANFTPGNIVVYRVDGGGAALNANGTAVFLDEYTPAGVLVQSVAMPTAGTSGRVVASGNATTEGFMTRSTDGRYLIVPGYDAAVATAGITTSTTVPRVIGRVDNTGAIDATSSYIDATSSGNLRSAASVDGTRYWTAGSTVGARTVAQGATTATTISTTATNMRQIAVFAGQLYIGSGAGTVRMATVGSGTPTTAGQTMTQLSGLPTATATINGFFFADLDGTPGLDTLYLCDETAGQIQKWSLVGSTWTQTGSVTLATARGLTGSVSGTTVTLFATGGAAGTPIVTVTDASGYNGTLSGTATTIVASAGTNKAFRGIALAPVSNPPTVSSINRANASPTNAASVGFTVTFSEAVTGVDSGDFTLATTGVTGASITSVTGSGATYTVTVNTGSGSGTVGLNLTDNDSILNAALTPLGGSGAGNGNFTGQVYTIDKTAPTVQSIIRVGAATTNAASVLYTVTFSESVTGVDSADFTVSSSGVAGANVTNVTGSGASYTVTVGTGSGSGTIRLDVLGASASVNDAVGNPLTADFTSGDVITIDKTAPAVQSSVRANADPTGAASVGFTVTFTEPVSGVDTGDFSLTTTGVTGTSVTGVTGSGAVYTVTVNTGTGTSGTIRLDVNAGTSITDAVGNPFGAAFTGGQFYTVDRNAPSVQTVVHTSTNPTNAASVNYTVTFSQSVTGVDTTDFVLTTTGVTGASVTNVSGSGAVYTVTVGTGTGDGSIRLDVLNNGSIQSGTSVPLTGGTFTTGDVYTVDKTAPIVSSIVRADSDPTKAATVHFTATFAESVTGVSASTFVLVPTGLTGTSITGVTGSGTTYTVTVNTGSGDGTLGLNAVADAAVLDQAANPFATPFTGQVYTVDKTAPTVLSINRADADPTAAASVHFTVTFSEAVTGVDSSDFSVAATGPTGTSVSGVTGSGTTYTVTVNTGSGDGTVGLNLADNDSIIDAASNPLGGTGAGNGNFTGQTYTVDKNAPSVVSINRNGANPIGTASVVWTVTFSESVTGVDASDFALVSGGGLTGASITTVTGSGTTYSVTANSGTGSGTLGLNLADDDSIVETAGFGTALGGPGAGNGNFTGQVFTLDKTPPSVVSINRTSTNPTSAATVQFSVVFSESVTGVGTADFATAASGVSGAAVTNVTGSGTTYTVTISTGTGSGTVGLNLVDDDSIIDAVANPLGGTGAGNGNFAGQVYTVNRAPATHVVISQVYGGGGNSGAIFKNDFIELFNPTGGTVDLTGWSVQYTSSAGSTWQVTNLSGTLAPGHYYLVQEAVGAGGTTNLPAPDATGTSAMAAGAGKVALVNQSSALSGSCPTGITIVDFVGYGTAANCSETATTATLTNTTSASRIDNGCTDTNNNSTDFTAGTVNPRNSASQAWSCGGLVGSGSATPSTVSATGMTLLKVSVTPGQSPTSTGITAIADLTPIGGSATQTLYDDGTNGDVTPGDNIFSANAIVDGATSSGPKTINVALSDAQSRTGAASISLTVLGATNPSGSGTATPASVAPSQSSLLTVTVTAGQNPTSTSLTATVDLTSIGGSASQTLFDDGTNGDATLGDGTFSITATVSAGTSLGAKSLPVTIHDVQGRTGTASIFLNVQSASAPPAPLNLVATPGNAQVSLAWTSSAGATGYNVYRSTTSGFYTTALASNVATNSYNDTAVANGTHYFYVVKATNGTESGPSNEASATPSAPQPSNGVKIYFIDIGQGASTLIVGPTGKTLLVDGGPTGQGTAKVVPLLNTLGINTVDYTVLTHYHIDHDDGLTETINANKIAGTAYDNGDTTALAPPNAGSTRTAYQNYTAALAAHSGTITRVRPEDVGGALAGTVIDLGGGMRATILEQGGKLLSGGFVTIDNSDLNTESISVLVEYNNFDFLISGDMTGGGSTSTAKTPDVETFVSQLAGDVDVVEFDHHGSTTANNPRFLRAIKAEAAVAEAGFTNTFGHPNRETFNKYLNIPATSGATYNGTALPNPGAGPVAYQTDPSPATDDRVTRQGYSGAAPANSGNGTILLKTDGTTSFTMESFDDGGARISAAAHAYSLDATGAGVTTNFPPTVIPSINPMVPTSTDIVTVQAMVNDREDPIASVTLNYALNGTPQAPQTMTLNAGFYEGTIAAQPDGTRVDYTVTAVAGGQSTSYASGYFAGITPISTLRVLDANGEPLYLDYAARVQGTATSDTNVFSVGTNDDYLQDATGGINIWRTIQPTVPAVQPIASGTVYTVAGRIGELSGRFHLEVTPPFVSPTTPYIITAVGSGVITPAVKTIAQINAGPEALEAQLVQINNCTVTSGTIPGSPAANDAFLTISDGTGSFQLKVDHDTNVPGMATPGGAFTVVGIIQQDDFLRPFDSGYDIAPRSRVDLGGPPTGTQGVSTIAAARIDVDGSGNTPGDYVPDLLNQTVHIQGVVTSINFRASSGSGIEYYIQDPTAGVDIFSTATTRAFAIGDNLDVTGTVKQFNGLTEIDPGATTTNLTVLAPGTLPAVQPQLITVSQLGDNGVGEPLEGALIRINNVTLTAPPATWAASTNYAMTDGSGTCGTCTIRISPSSNLVGQPAPAGAFSIIGVTGQFDSAAPFDSGYQIFPRSTSDILPAVPATASISATAGTPQSATVGNAFAAQLQATVFDAGNAPIAGAGVTFTAPASGASGTFSNGTTTANVITDGSGVATAPVFTANAAAGTYSVTAANGSFTTTFSLTNLAQTATHFSVSAPANVTSGVAFNVTVTALNASNATVTGYDGTVNFSSGSNGSLPADYTFTAGDNGTHTFPATLTTAGAQVIDVGDGSISGSANITVNPPPATHFSVSAPANVTSGAPFNVTVTALDASNATVPSYSGTVQFNSSSAGTLPANYTFIGSDNGAHTFSVTLTSTGAQSITATDTSSSITGTANTTVAPPPATHYSVSAPANVTSGVAFNVIVTALDASNATVTGYTGTAHFTSSSAGTLPADYTFVGGDNGTHTFSVTLTSTGARTITATDTSAAISGTANTTVAPPPATHYSVTAPANVTNGVAFNITVTALDASNTTVPTYAGTAHFTSSSSGTLPADYTFTGGDNGTHTFSVTLTSNGARTITATDTSSAITGTANTTVLAAPATHLSVSVPGTMAAGFAFNVTVTALDASNATVTGYAGTVHFTSSSSGTLPADYTFIGGDNGTHTFSVTLNNPGAQTITATDTASSSINGTGSTTGICPPVLILATATNSGPGCVGGSVNLFGSGGGAGATFSWTGPGGFTSTQQNPTGITVAGVYNLTVSSPSPCINSGSASTTVVFNSAPAISLPAALSACGAALINVPFTLTGTAPWTIHWSDGIVQSGITSSSASRSVSATASMVLSAVTVTDANCTSAVTAGVTITISNPPAITTQPVGQIVNPGDQATFTVVATGGGLHYQWFVKHANGATLPVGTDAASYTTLAEGNATWFVRITDSCGSIDSVSVDALVVTPRHHPSH